MVVTWVAERSSQTMLVVNFTRSLPPFVPPTAEGSVVLIFDPTLAGYRDAVQWRLRNPNETTVFRLVIPYTPTRRDVGDFLCSPTDETIGLTLPEHYEYQLVPVSNEPVDDKWPFPSRNRWGDFQAAERHLLNDLQLRDAATGLSPLQQYMLDNRGVGETEVRALCCAHFKVPLAVVKVQFRALVDGNLPLWRNPELVLPTAMVNGPYPMDPREVARGIKQAIDFGHPDWEALEPSCPPYTFTRLSATEWVSIAAAQHLPYGANPDDFTVVSKPHHKLLFSRSADTSSSYLLWDPVFKQGRFTRQEYMVFWLSAAQDKYADERVALLEQREKQERGQEFMRWVWTFTSVNATKEKRSDERWYRPFVDENEAGKRRRVMEKFDGDESLLDLPIRMLSSPDVSLCDEEELIVPQCARDLLLLRMEQYLY
jgi:hypothetical protein